MATKITPRATEKTYALTTEKNVYVFNVPLDMNKNQIKQAIEEEFDVSVVAVRTVVQQGKLKRINKSQRNPKRYVAATVSQKDTKKAYVSVKEGDKIAVFEGAEAATEEDK